MVLKDVTVENVLKNCRKELSRMKVNKQEIEKAIELMKNEVNCILRASNCDRECEKCDLVKTDTELLAAYEKAINALERQLNNGWIPVTDGDYIVTIKGGEVIECQSLKI
jgi:hypothetical protein